MIGRLSIAAILAATALPASAATITVTQTLDLTQPRENSAPGSFGWQGSPAFNGGYDVSIAEGDTFDFTIDFLGAQTLTLVNVASFWAFSYANGSPTAVTATGSIALLDANGNALALSDLKTSTEGDVHLGQFLLASDFFDGFPDPLTFYGVRYVGTVDEYASIPGQSRNYDKAGFYVNADQAIIGNAVPEPTTWAMMIAGFGLCGAGLRVRAKRMVATA